MKTADALILGLAACWGLIAACATSSPSIAEPCRPLKAYQAPPAWEDIVSDARRIKTLAAKIEIVSPEPSAAKLHGLLTYRAPDSLRVEVISPWGQPASYFILSDNQIAFFNFGDNRLILGPAKGSLIKEYLGLELHPSWLFALLNGRGWITSPPHPQLSSIEVITGSKIISLYYPQEGFQESIRWDEGTGEVGEILFVSMENNTVVKAQIEDFLCSQNISFPKTIKLSSSDGRQARITFTQIAINNPIEPSVFEIPRPQEGMKTYYLK